MNIYTPSINYPHHLMWRMPETKKRSYTKKMLKNKKREEKALINLS